MKQAQIQVLGCAAGSQLVMIVSMLVYFTDLLDVDVTYLYFGISHNPLIPSTSRTVANTSTSLSGDC